MSRALHRGKQQEALQKPRTRSMGWQLLAMRSFKLSDVKKATKQPLTEPPMSCSRNTTLAQHPARHNAQVLQLLQLNAQHRKRKMHRAAGLCTMRANGINPEPSHDAAGPLARPLCRFRYFLRDSGRVCQDRRHQRQIPNLQLSQKLAGVLVRAHNLI